MEAILIEPKNKNEFEIINEFLKSNGIASLTISEKKKRYLAGLEMVEIAERHPKFNISDDEIAEMGKNVEAEIYARFKL